MEIIKKLKEIDLFSYFEEDFLKDMLKDNSYKVESFLKGEAIFNEGEICKYIHIILEGSVLIEKIDASGRYLAVGEAKKGEMMGPNVLFSKNSIYPLSTKARERVIIFMIPKSFLLKLCQSNLDFLEEVFRITSSKAFMLTRRLDEITVQTLRQNISRFLLSQVREGAREISLPFTKKEWADSLGVQRPSLSRELKKLEDMEIIKVKRNIIEIIDIAGLEELI